MIPPSSCRRWQQLDRPGPAGDHDGLAVVTPLTRTRSSLTALTGWFQGRGAFVLSVEDFGGQHVDALCPPIDPIRTRELLPSDKHPALRQRARDRCGVISVREDGPPRLGRDQPCACVPLSTAPAVALVSRPLSPLDRIEARGAVALDKASNLLDHVPDLDRLKSAAALQPCLVHRHGGRGCRARPPGHDPELDGYLPRRGREREPIRDSLHLSVGRIVHVSGSECLYSGTDLFGNGIRALVQETLHKGRASRAVGSAGGSLDAVCELLWVVAVARVVEDTKPLAGVGRDVDDPHFLPRARALAALHDLVDHPHLSGRNDLAPPSVRRPERAVTAGAALTGAAAEGVDDLPDFPGVCDPDLVKHERTIVVQDRRSFEAIGGVAPGPDEPSSLIAAPEQRRSGIRCRGLSGGRLPVEVNAAALRIYEFGQHRGKGDRYAEHDPILTGGQFGDRVAPLVESAHRSMWRILGADEYNAFTAGVADRALGKHVHLAGRQ